MCHSRSCGCWLGQTCLCLVILVAVAASLSIGLGFAIRPSSPKCSIEKFYIPALNHSVNSNTTTSPNITIYYDLQLFNPHVTDADSAGQKIYYDALNLTIYYQPPNTITNAAGYHQLIANKTISEFTQCAGCTNAKEESVELKKTDGDAIFKAVLDNQTVVFKVKMVTRVRFSNWYWKTKRYKIDVGANVEVTNEGTKVNKKGIKLKSAAPHRDFDLVHVIAAVVFSFYILCSNLI